MVNIALRHTTRPRPPCLLAWPLMRSLWSLARLATRVSDSVMSYNNTPERRRFRRPCFIVKDGAGQTLAYVYFGDA